MAAAISPVPQPRSRMRAGGGHSSASRAVNCSTREFSFPCGPYLLRQPRASWLNRARTSAAGGICPRLATRTDSFPLAVRSSTSTKRAAISSQVGACARMRRPFSTSLAQVRVFHHPGHCPGHALGIQRVEVDGGVPAKVMGKVTVAGEDGQSEIAWLPGRCGKRIPATWEKSGRRRVR